MPDLYQRCECKTCKLAYATLHMPSPLWPEKLAKDSIPSMKSKEALGTALDVVPASPDMPKREEAIKTIGVWWCGCAVDGSRPCGKSDLGHIKDLPVQAAKPENIREQGLKYDDGKPPMDLLPGEALEAIAQALAFGAKKYGRDNWRKGFNWSRLLGAGLRHLSAFGRGERKDPESGLSHLAHAGAMLLFLLTHEVTGIGTDDLYKGNENATAK